MERVLHGEEISRLMEAFCHLDRPIFYFPVRHHSPACSRVLLDIIRRYEPDCILIEGPENANDLIEDMTDENTLAPFCIYYSYRDKKGFLDEKKGDYRCYYPFVDYSPELVALREGRKQGTHLSFIDLPYEEILLAEKEGVGLRRQEEKNSYNDDRYLTENKFIQGVVQRSGCRGFEEFWERSFEMGVASKSSEEFLHDMLLYCTLSRANTTVDAMREDGCLQREAHMRMRIAEASKQYKKILVVTGGFHVPGLVGKEKWLLSGETGKALPGDLFNGKVPEGLLAFEEPGKPHAIDPKDKGVYLMSYSMEATDSLNGYCSGMPHPMFYQKIWEGEGSLKDIFEGTVLAFLVEVGKKVRRKEGYPSTFDEICAMNMSEGLSMLRGKPFPGVYELTDSVLSNYVKGEYQLATDRPMRVLREELTGKRIGKLTEHVKLPPLCADFEMLCHSYRMDVHSSTKKELTLSPFAKKKHREISAFLYRMRYLGTGFATCKKGPNLHSRKDRNLIREIWEYNYSPKVMSTLIEASVYGGSILEACRSLAEGRLREETDAGGASELIVQMFEMGIPVENPFMIQRLGEVIQGSGDFFSLTKTFRNLIMLLDMQDYYGYESDLMPLRDLTAQKLLTLLGHMTNVKDEDVNGILEALKELYRVLMDAGLAGEREEFKHVLGKMSESPDLNPSLAGAVWGLLYAYGEKSAEEVSVCTRGFLLASGEKAGMAAFFVRGLFFVARDILFAKEDMIDMLDDFLRRTSYDDFLKYLPSLRLAFSFFTPAETDRLAGLVAGRYGMKRKDFQELGEVTGEEMEYGRALEQAILERLA